jgi:hypothetical protein
MHAMKKYEGRNKELDDILFSKFENRETITSICPGEDMPSLRAVQKGRRQDTEFEVAVHSLWERPSVTPADI